MSVLKGIHHIAIICSNFQVSKNFYVNVLGLEIIAEHFRAARQSYKLDLKLGEQYVVELFSFPNPPPRVSKPEAAGLRHLAFAVSDLEKAIAHVNKHGVVCESIRVDEFTGKRFTFFSDPDGLPLEFYEK